MRIITAAGAGALIAALLVPASAAAQVDELAGMGIVFEVPAGTVVGHDPMYTGFYVEWPENANRLYFIPFDASDGHLPEDRLRAFLYDDAWDVEGIVWLEEGELPVLEAVAWDPDADAVVRDVYVTSDLGLRLLWLAIDYDVDEQPYLDAVSVSSPDRLRAALTALGPTD